MPQVLNKRKAWPPAGAIYVGRPSRWGNPFEIGRDGDRAAVIERFKAMLDAVRRELVGRDLVCFCAPLACHADVLLAAANP